MIAIRYLTDTDGRDARFSYDAVYFEMALDALMRWQKAMIQGRNIQLEIVGERGSSQEEMPNSKSNVPLPRLGISPSVNKSIEAGKKRWDATKESINCIVFSVMSLEAFINEFGAYYKSNSYFDNYLDELSLKSRWKTITDLICENGFPTDGIEFEMLDKVVKKRNDLVHSDGVEVGMEEPIVNTFPREESNEIIQIAPLPIQTVTSCIEKISDLKPDYERCKLFRRNIHPQFEDIEIDIESHSKDLLRQ